MYMAIMNNEVFELTNYLDEMEYRLGELDEATDIVVEKWEPDGCGWYVRKAQADYYVHEGRVGFNE